MKVFKFVAISLVLSLFTLSGCASNKITNRDYSETITKTNNFLTQQSFTGTVLVSYDGEVLFANGYGLTDSQNPESSQITADARMEIGSITKQMTAACIMQLVEQGKLSVDENLTKYFPDYIHADQITIKNLLTMRSGIKSSAYSSKEVLADVATALSTGGENTIDKQYWVELLNNNELSFTPDSLNDYNNLNYILLAYIIEQASGIPYEQYIQENIFDRCGMNNTNRHTAQVDVKPFDSRDYNIPNFYAIGAGDINSNVYDLNKWMHSFTSGLVVSKESINEMTWGRMKDSLEYGYGFLYGGTKIFHSGSTIGYNSYITYDMETKLTVIVLSNKRAGVKNAQTMAQVVETFWKTAIE